MASLRQRATRQAVCVRRSSFVEILSQHGDVRLVRREGQQATLLHGTEPLLEMPLAPSWHAPSPVGVARILLGAMRHASPKFTADAPSRGMMGGIYCAPHDSITLYRADELTEHERASCILHECLHATGHPSRLARPCFHWSEADAQLDPNDYATPAGEFTSEPAELQREEFTARIGTALLSVRLGLYPCGGSHWYRWMPRAAVLPLETLRGAIADAERAVAFLLHERD